MDLAYLPGTVQFSVFKRIVSEKFNTTKIDFSKWGLETDRNNHPTISHHGQIVADGSCVKTKKDMCDFVNGCNPNVFFN